jgi:hypothetical protein
MSTITGTDLFIVSRGGINFELTASALQTGVLSLPATDLFIVDRGGSNYKVTVSDFISYLNAP